MQLRFETGLTGEDYVTRQAWREARLLCCPLHPSGGCGFARHGTYARKRPRGTRISRWYCREGHCTFSLLPDHLAARFPGTLAEIEQVVAVAESASSLEAAAERVRPDSITLPSALRWMRRRIAAVRSVLAVIVGMFPQALLGASPSIGAFRLRLHSDAVLVKLRAQAASFLSSLASPLGFRHRAQRVDKRVRAFQHPMGPDPPTGID